jgi:hypothetical protein
MPTILRPRKEVSLGQLRFPLQRTFSYSPSHSIHMTDGSEIHVTFASDKRLEMVDSPLGVHKAGTGSFERRHPAIYGEMIPHAQYRWR